MQTAIAGRPVTQGTVTARAGSWRTIRWEHEVPGLKPGWAGLWQHAWALMRGRPPALVSHKVVLSAWVTNGKNVKVEGIVVCDMGVVKCN
jgi:hypothetical protein